MSMAPSRPSDSRSRRSALRTLLPELVQILHERHHRAVEALHLWVGRLDHVVLVGRVRATAVAEAEVAGGELERRVGEGVAGIRAGVARPEHRIDAGALEHRDLRLDQRRARRGAGWIVAAGDVDFDVAEAALGEMRFQCGYPIRPLRVWPLPHV